MGIYDRDYYREDSRWHNPFARSQGTLFLVLLYCFLFIVQVAGEKRWRIWSDNIAMARWLQTTVQACSMRSCWIRRSR